MQKDHHIGLFDSGIGGLTVLRAIQDKLPKESTVYFGDTARLPYGDKSAETILRYSIENAIFLMEQNIKMLVIPCNTVSSVALDKLRKIFNIPVIGVIEPGAEHAVKTTKNKRIAVLGTKRTIESGAYHREILKLDPESHVIGIACPLFVPLVEEGMQFHQATHLIVKEYLTPLLDANIDTVVLGCTHYPVLKDIIQDFLGPRVQIVDSATTCAHKVAEILSAQKLQTTLEKVSHQFYVSDNPQKFRTIGQQFFSEPLPEVLMQPAFIMQASHKN